MSARAEGYAWSGEDAASGDGNVLITLFRGASVSGIVLLPDGAPAAGAYVECSGESGFDSASVEADGRFEFRDLEPGFCTLDASLQSGLSAEATITLAEGDSIAGLRLVLRPRGSSYVRVRVADAKGAAIAGADVGARGRTATDAEGLATLVVTGPPGAEIGVDIRAEGFVSASVSTATFATSDAPPVCVTLREAVLVTVDARAEGGAPLDPSVGFDGGHVTTPDDDVGWYLDPEAAYSVRIAADGFLPQEIEGWRPPLGGGVLAAALRPCASVRGRALDPQGRPVARVLVEVDTVGERQRIDCDADGNFLIPELPEGPATVAVGTAAEFPALVVAVTGLSGHVTDAGTLTLAPHVALAGRVVDASSRPLGGAHLRFASVPQTRGEGAFSHADGTFRILVPGFLAGHVVASKRGHGTARASVAAGTARSIGDITLPEAGAVEVEADAGEVEIAWPDGVVAERAWRGVIGDLAPGRYVVRLEQGQGTLEREVEVVAGETAKVTFPLER